MKNIKTATIYDIAEKCNLSPSTVSRVLSNSSYIVSEKSRAKVLKAAKELSYMPNLMGKFLRKQTTNEIGIVVPEISNYDFVVLSQEIQKQALELGYNTVLCNSLSDPKIETRNINLLIQKRVSGVIMNTLNTTGESAEMLLENGIRVVLIDQYFEKNCNRISVDFDSVATLAVDYLWGKGHRKIAFLSQPIDRATRQILLESFKREMTKRGVENVSEHIILSNFHVSQKENQQYFCFEDGERLVNSICNHKESPTAIFCNNDLTAIAIMYDLKQRGIRVPEDISVIGVDNNPFSYIIQPPLTSIDNSTAQIAKMATKILIEQITNDSNNVISYVKPSLVERESVACIV